MKFTAVVLAAALLAPAAATYDSTIDLGKVQAQLGAMMGAANDELKRAEAHHEKAVSKARDEVIDDYDDAAGTAGDAVVGFEADLVRAEVKLEAVVNASKATLAQAAKAPGADDWEGPGFMEKARLGAQVAAAERSLRHMRRQRTTLVQEAESQAVEPFEDESEKLGMILGDLSKDTDEAKEKIQGTVSYIEESGNFTRNATRELPKAATPPVAKTAQEEQARLQSLGKSLEKATKESKAIVAQASKTLALKLATVAKDQSGKADAVKKDIHDAQIQEVGSVDKVGQRAAKRITNLRKKAMAAAGKKKAGGKIEAAIKAVDKVGTTAQKKPKTTDTKAKDKNQIAPMVESLAKLAKAKSVNGKPLLKIRQH